MDFGDIMRNLGDTVEENFYPEKYMDRIEAKRAKRITLTVNISYGMISLIIVCVIGVVAMMIWLTSGPALLDTWKSLNFMPVDVTP
jgi:hypothetical protein